MSTDPYATLAERFEAHYETVRGAVRSVVASRQLDAHLRESPMDILDVGGGTGRQAMRLAGLGHRVTVLEPSAEMLARGRNELEGQTLAVRRRVVFVQGTAEQGPSILRGRRFDAILCHGVVPYVEDPRPIVHALAALAADGAVISLITKNRDALAMRAALEGRFADAVLAFDADRDVGGIGIPTRADRLVDVVKVLALAGFDLDAWYGIRVFTDHIGDQVPGADIGAVLDAETMAGSRDPYRGVARLLHLIARRRPRKQAGPPTPVPDALVSLVDAWRLVGRPRQNPMPWPRDRWLAAFEEGDASLRQLANPLDREALRDAVTSAGANPESAVAAFVAVMAWGYGNVGFGPYRTRGVLDATADVGQRLAAVVTTLNVDGAVAAYRRFATDARLHGLGPAFGTKYLYFTQWRGAMPRALILDRVVATWLARHADLELDPTAWSERTYGRYLERMHAWAGELGCSPDEVEFVMFQAVADEREGERRASP